MRMKEVSCFLLFSAVLMPNGKSKNILHYSVKRYTGVAVREDFEKKKQGIKTKTLSFQNVSANLGKSILFSLSSILL